jgi:hypothetical protein
MIPESHNLRQTRLLLILSGSLLFAYTATKAFLLAITWDEAYTYIEFARNGKVLLEKFELMSANNHILNTWAMMWSVKIFGLHEFVMRLPVLLAHGLFLYYSARLVMNLKSKWLIITSFLILNLNPYMLDFFSVARGYGLSFGFMMGSVYFFYRFHQYKGTVGSALLSLLLASFGVLSSFVLLNYFVVLYGAMFILNFYFERKKAGSRAISGAVKKMILPTLLVALVIWFVLPIATNLKEAGALFFGGERTFWSDTISTIIDRCFYEIGYNYWFQRLVKGFIFLILLLSAGLIIRSVKRKQVETGILFLFSLLFLLVFCCLSTVVQHHLMQTPYLLDRTALFLVILFSLILVFFISEMQKHLPFAVPFSAAISGILSLHFILCFNLSYVLEWKNDCNTKEMLTDLEKIKKVPEGKETVSIGIPLIFDPAINFYREKNNLTWLNTAWRVETRSPCHDYYFLSKDELNKMSPDSLVVIKEYALTGNVLAQPRFKPKRIESLEHQVKDFSSEAEGKFNVNESVEYSPGFSIVVTDSLLRQKTSVIAFYAEVSTPELKNNNLIMVLSFQDKYGNLYSWQKAYVKDFIKNEKDYFRTSFTCIIPHKTVAGDEIKAYIWNPDKHQLFLKKEEVAWLSYHF